MRTFGRIEKAVLVVVAGFVFMGIASTASPGLQTVVAGVACPAGTDSAAVVRYPPVAEPSEMVRNTPLVCLVGDRAVLASHWRVLPALFGVGLIAATVVVGLLSAVASVVRRAGDERAPQRPRTTFERLRFLPLLVATPFVGMTAYGLYWWLAVDTPYRVSGCQGSNGGSATCYDGEPVYRMLSLLFGALALIGLVVWAVAVRRSLARTRRFRRAWATGNRAPATLIDVGGTNTRVNNQPLYRFTYEVRPTEGSPPFTFEEKGLTSPAGRVGGVVEVVYDPRDPGAAFIVPPDAAGGRDRGPSDSSAPGSPVVTW